LLAFVVVNGLLLVYFTGRQADEDREAEVADAGRVDYDSIAPAADGVPPGVDDGCGICPADRPHCDHGEGRCVACEAPEHCTGPLSACMNGVCVECETSRDCDALELPECYFGTHACRACTSDDACLFRGAASHCIEGRCSEAGEPAP
jgi:hypothetical protein